MSLDLKDPDSLEVLKKLIDTADVFLANFTQRALDDLTKAYVGVFREFVKAKGTLLRVAPIGGGFVSRLAE